MKWIVTIIWVCSAITAHGQRKDTAHVIPPQVMIQIIKDVERGKACEIEVQLLLDRLAIAENKEIKYNDILTLLQRGLKDCEAINQEQEKALEIERKAAKKAKFERNVLGGVLGVVVLLVLVL